MEPTSSPCCASPDLHCLSARFNIPPFLPEGGKGFGAPDVFDNAYYQSLLRKPWLDPKDPMATMIGLPSDHVLPDDPECLPIIQVYMHGWSMVQWSMGV